MNQEQVLFWAFAFFVFLVLVVMQWCKKLPTVKSLQELSSVINSRGGNIMVLGGLSLLFFWSALRFTYWIIDHSMNGKISETDALAMAAFTWMTGSAFGGAFTSMVKAMTGQDSSARRSDAPTTHVPAATGGETRTLVERSGD